MSLFITGEVWEKNKIKLNEPGRQKLGRLDTKSLVSAPDLEREPCDSPGLLPGWGERGWGWGA